MLKSVAEFLGFNAWLLAVTLVAFGVFRTIALVVLALDLPEALMLLVGLPASVATWYFVGTRSLRAIQKLYDRAGSRGH